MRPRLLSSTDSRAELYDLSSHSPLTLLSLSSHSPTAPPPPPPPPPRLPVLLFLPFAASSFLPLFFFLYSLVLIKTLFVSLLLTSAMLMNFNIPFSMLYFNKASFCESADTVYYVYCCITILLSSTPLSPQFNLHFQ
jgi:hypothetical protein